MLLMIDDFKDEKIQNPESRNSESGFKNKARKTRQDYFSKGTDSTSLLA